MKITLPSALVSFLALLLPLAGAASGTEAEFFRNVGPRQTALVIEGELSAIVHVQQVGRDRVLLKVRGPVGKSMYDWIETSFNNGHERRSGEFVSVGFDGQTRLVRQFRDAVITEIDFPILDGASGNATREVSVEIRGSMRDHPKDKDPPALDFTVMREWQPPSFRLVPCINGNCN